MSIFQHLNQEGKTVILVTHEPDIAQHCNRIIRFKDGRVVSDETVAEPINADEQLAKLPNVEEMDEVAA